MDIVIKKLSPELIEDYVEFFDKTPHSERPDDNDCKCYCVWWCNDDHDIENIEFLLSPEKRRNYSKDMIRANNIQGYLAYYNNEVVGWCNANTKLDCLGCYCWKRFMGSMPIGDTEQQNKVKSIFCFAITPKMKRKGIAKLLLESVCKDALHDGFDYVEAYPNKIFVGDAEDFMGPIELYKKYDFSIYHETREKLMVRKRLK
jgi:GNAT superfamily N-acetyltransferase